MLSTLLALVAASVNAGQTPALEGRVLDAASGRPLVNAEVSVLGRAGAALTDGEGRFRLSPIPRPPFEILVVLPNGSLARPIMIGTAPAGPLVVRVNAAVDEQITVSGAAPSIDAAPGAATASVSGRDLAVRAPENLIQALENVAGVNQVSEGHAGVPAVRGLSAGRTLILIDGGRVTSERRVGPSATFLDPSVLEAIDVARGPGSVAYGSDAFGGVISVRTRRVEAVTPFRARLEGLVSGGVPEQRFSVDAGKGFRRAGVYAQAHYRNAEDYDSPAGPVFNSGWEDQGFIVRTTHLVGEGHLSLGWQSDFGKNLERPRNNSRTVRFFYPEDTSHRLTANYQIASAGPLAHLSIDALLGRYINVTDQDRFATARSPRAVERADIRANDYQLRAVSERVAGTTRITTGIDLNGRVGLSALDIFEDYDLDGARVARRESVSIDDAARHDAALFAQLDAAVAPRIRLSGGGRVDHIRTSSDGGFFGARSTAHTALSGFLSAIAGPFDGVSLTGQVSRGFRDPALSDRYFRGPSGRGFVTGNPDLQPETSFQLDGAIRYTTGPARIGLNVYRYEIRDLIERYGDGDNFFFRNRGEAVLQGIEAEAQATLPGALTLEFTAQVAQGVTPADDMPLDGITPGMAAALARRSFGDRGFVQGRVAWFREDDEPGPTERLVNGYTLVDVVGGARVLSQLELRGQIRNLFDVTYFATQATRAVLAPGRVISLTAVMRF